MQSESTDEGIQVPGQLDLLNEIPEEIRETKQCGTGGRTKAMNRRTVHGDEAREWTRELGRTGRFAPEQLLLVWLMALTVNDQWESDETLETLSTDAGMSMENVKHHLEILRENNVVSWFARDNGVPVATAFTLNRRFPDSARR